MSAKEQIDLVYQARQARLTHPRGEFDKQGRWYPSGDENSDNFTSAIRSPSRNWRYSYMVAARTRKHIAALAHCNPVYFDVLVKEITR